MKLSNNLISEEHTPYLSVIQVIPLFFRKAQKNALQYLTYDLCQWNIIYNIVRHNKIEHHVEDAIFMYITETTMIYYINLKQFQYRL